MQPPRAGWRGVSCFKYFGARQFGRSRRLTKVFESSRVKELAPTSSRFLERISYLEALYVMCGRSKDRARSRLRPALDQRSAWPGRLGRGRRSEISFRIDTLRRSLHPRRVPIRQGADVILIVHIFRIEIAGDSPVAVLGPNLRRLRGADQPEIMFCVLQIVLCGDRIVAGMSVARQLEVLLRHLPRGASYFDVRPI
jgi:hypothetical protein